MFCLYRIKWKIEKIEYIIKLCGHPLVYSFLLLARSQLPHLFFIHGLNLTTFLVNIYFSSSSDTELPVNSPPPAYCLPLHIYKTYYFYLHFIQLKFAKNKLFILYLHIQNNEKMGRSLVIYQNIWKRSFVDKHIGQNSVLWSFKY